MDVLFENTVDTFFRRIRAVFKIAEGTRFFLIQVFSEKCQLNKV